MTNRLVINDADELNRILKRAFAGIASPLERQQGVWGVLEEALAEAYALGAANAALLLARPPASPLFKGLSSTAQTLSVRPPKP